MELPVSNQWKTLRVKIFSKIVISSKNVVIIEDTVKECLNILRDKDWPSLYHVHCITYSTLIVEGLQIHGTREIRNNTTLIIAETLIIYLSFWCMFFFRICIYIRTFS